MELLKTLYSIYSPSTGEKKMRRFIKRWIYNNIPQVEVATDAKGNIYVTKGIAENYPCIVSHIDQVQKTHSRDFVCIESEDVISVTHLKTIDKRVWVQMIRMVFG